jgi:low affinity Fe/Cu permease
LHPYPRLLLWDLVDPYLTHSHCAVLVIQPEVNIVILIPAALATEVRARKIAAILLKLPYRLMHFHELEREFLTGRARSQDYL